MISKIPDSEKEILLYFDNPKYAVKNGHVAELDLSNRNLQETILIS